MTPARYAVLVVDDEPENLDLLSRTLSFDHDVHCAASGDEALAVLRDIPNLALIITDQRMPGMIGTELLRQARRVRGDTVRIILTGFADPRDLIDAINSSNVYRYMTKPWDIDVLQEVVRRAVRLYEAGGEDLVCDVTGLIRTGLFHRELEREIFRARLTGLPVAVISLELVGFSAYREKTSLAEAEQLLRSVADDLRPFARPLDMLCLSNDSTFILCAPGVEGALEERISNGADGWTALAEARTKVPALGVIVKRVDLAARHDSAGSILAELVRGGLPPS